jgi:hypothetical protein
MLYRSAEPEPSVYQDLVSTLVAQLGRNADSPLIQEAATKWADVVDRPAVATDIDMALDQAVSALDQLGFVARVSPVGDSITLASCPYADLIADQPVICDIHTALLQELLDRTGQPVSVAQMQVWAASGVCRSRLSRPDRRPARVIDVAGTDDERAVAGSQAATSPVADPGERGGSGNGKNGNAKSKAGFGKKGTSA